MSFQLHSTQLLIMNLKSSLTTILSLILAFFIPLAPLVITVGLCITIDTIFGVIRAKKVNEKITSRRLSKLVSKMLLYQLTLLTVFVLEKFILGDFIIYFTAINLFLSKLVACVLCFVELKSIHESFEIISGTNLWNTFKNLLIRVGKTKDDINDAIN